MRFADRPEFVPEACGLFFMNGLYRADIHASTAIRTQLGIYHIDITLGNSFFRTFINTGTTGCTFIIYYVCHLIYGLLVKQFLSKVIF